MAEMDAIKFQTKEAQMFELLRDLHKWAGRTDVSNGNAIDWAHNVARHGDVTGGGRVPQNADLFPLVAADRTLVKQLYERFAEETAINNYSDQDHKNLANGYRDTATKIEPLAGRGSSSGAHSSVEDKLREAGRLFRDGLKENDSQGATLFDDAARSLGVGSHTNRQMNDGGFLAPHASNEFNRELGRVLGDGAISRDEILQLQGIIQGGITYDEAATEVVPPHRIAETDIPNAGRST